MIVRTVRALRSLLARQIRGSFPPALVGTDSSGDRGEIGYGRDPRATLVFTFTKECPECQESWQALRTAQSLSPSSLRIARALRGRVPCNFRRHTRRRFGRAAPHRLHQSCNYDTNYPCNGQACNTCTWQSYMKYTCEEGQPG